jgi:hypothetical protein
MSRILRSRWLVVLLLVIHGALLAFAAVVDSPTWDEAAHLPSGISHWISGSFRLYRVNPPLVRLVAALPILTVDHGIEAQQPPEVDMRYRYEFVLGRQFFEHVGADGPRLMTIARWMCIPFSLIGAIACCRWAQELYGRSAGIMALALWCFSPTILAYGHLITPDIGAAGLGVAASYRFWIWLRRPTWKNTCWAGLTLGFAELTKSTWIVLFALWPIIWVVWRVSAQLTASSKPAKCNDTGLPRDDENGSNSNPVATSAASSSCHSWWRNGVQLALICLIAIDLINFGYAGEGSFQLLGDLPFTSDLFGGNKDEFSRQLAGNRFTHSWLANVPVPLPANYVLGIDVQRADFEARQWSYLRGEWRLGGWWYYYLYALAIKEPLATVCLLILSTAALLLFRSYRATWRDEIVLLAPAIVVLALVSSQTGINHHVRYALPCLPFFFISISRMARSIDLKQVKISVLVSGLLLWSIASSLYYYPHDLSYFNELVGGPGRGHYHLANSNVDWGQNLLYLKEWYDTHPKARPLHVAYDMDVIDPKSVGIRWLPVPAGPILNRPGAPISTSWPWATRPLDSHGTDDDYTRRMKTTDLTGDGPQPGWFAVSLNQIHDRVGYLEYFLEFDPVCTLACSMNIYKITVEDANRVRRQLGLPLLQVTTGDFDSSLSLRSGVE